MRRVRRQLVEEDGTASEGEEEEEEECSLGGSTETEAGGEGEAGEGEEVGSAAGPCVKRAGGRAKRGGKRSRLSWTPDMHRDFLAAVQKLGGPWTATPKAILDMMDSTKGLTLTNIKSHLQKFRLKATKERRLEREQAQAEAGMLAAFGGTAAAAAAAARSLAAGVPLAGGPRLPGVVAVPAVGPGVPLLRSSPLLVAPADVVPPAAPPHSPPAAAASQALALAAQQPELEFADAALGAQAAMWRRRQQQVQAALAATLAQQQQVQLAADGEGGASPATSALHQLQQASLQQRLSRLQAENLQCLKILCALHVAQMSRHLEQAGRLKSPSQSEGEQQQGGQGQREQQGGQAQLHPGPGQCVEVREVQPGQGAAGGAWGAALGVKPEASPAPPAAEVMTPKKEA